ncbi:hypothetical protein CSUI_003048 [Cystoisospora suis]|uniref:Uncharacterized protein n=1 Tax=Cystoisospora suis TaxID=483139 RepID=A0A2C6KRS0_9APIC|nr:hypothetical protein CSUI_003048 [Cystoisospora suis]
MRDRCKMASACTDGLNIPIPSSFSYDAELSKFLEVLAAPLLQSHDEPDLVQAGTTGQKVEATQEQRLEGTEAVCGWSEKRRTRNPSFCVSESLELALLSSQSREEGHEGANCERAGEGAHAELGRNEYLKGGQRGGQKGGPKIQRSFDDTPSGFAHPLSIETSCPQQTLASSLLCVPSLPSTETPSRLGGRCRLPGGEAQQEHMSVQSFAGSFDHAVRHGQKSPKKGVSNVDEEHSVGPLAEILLEGDLHDVLDLERGIGSVLLIEPEVGLEEDCKAKVTRLSLRLSLSPPETNFDAPDVHGTSAGSLSKEDLLSQTTGNNLATLPRSFRSRSDYLSLCSLQNGASAPGKERPPRSLDELKALQGSETLSLAEIHLLAQSLAADFMDSVTSRSNGEPARHVLKYRRDNLSFAVVQNSNRVWNPSRGRKSPDGCGEAPCAGPQSSVNKESLDPWSLRAGICVSPFAKSGLTASPDPSLMGGAAGPSRVAETGLNDTTVEAVINAFLKATSFFAPLAASRQQQSSGRNADEHGSWAKGRGGGRTKERLDSAMGGVYRPP